MTPARSAIDAQVTRHERGVDVQRITQMWRDAQRVGREDEAVGHRQRHFLAEQFDPRLETERLRLVPEVVERPALDQRAEARRTDARNSGPVAAQSMKRGSQAVGGLRLVDEVVLVDAEETQQLEDGGLRRFGVARKHGFGRLDDVN